MGYSTSPKTIYANWPLLTPLLQGEGQPEIIQHFTELGAVKQANKIRECFNVARLHRKEFPRLYKISLMYQIKVIGASVVAKRNPTPDFDPASIPVQDVLVRLSAETSGQIIQLYIDHPGLRMLTVNRAELSGPDQDEINEWAGTNGWSVVWQGKQLTIHFEKK